MMVITIIIIIIIIININIINIIIIIIIICQELRVADSQGGGTNWEFGDPRLQLQQVLDWQVGSSRRINHLKIQSVQFNHWSYSKNSPRQSKRTNRTYNQSNKYLIPINRSISALSRVERLTHLNPSLTLTFELWLCPFQGTGASLWKAYRNAYLKKPSQLQLIIYNYKQSRF